MRTLESQARGARRNSLRHKHLRQIGRALFVLSPCRISTYVDSPLVGGVGMENAT